MRRVRILLVAGLSAVLLATSLGQPSGAADGRVGSTPAAQAGPGDAGPAERAGDGGGPYRVPTKAFFNNPRGSWTKRLTIERQIVKAIDNSRKGSTIRIALYSFDRVPVAQRLIAARNRGVHVQLLLNDHQDTRAMKLLRARLGTDTSKRDFIYKCRSGCRTDGRKRLLHSKFYTFTHTGASRSALFVGSHNLTMNAARHQWNDLFLSSGNKPLFDQYVGLFEDMKSDYRRAQEPLTTFCGVPLDGVSCNDAVDLGTTVTFPRLVGPGNDPIVQILDKVQCITQTADGQRVRTRLAVNMHTIRGRRGDYLADAFRTKFAEGCAARFSFGLVGFRTKGHLGASTPRGRLPLRSTSFDYNPDVQVENPDGKLDLTLDYYSHQKYLVIQGNYAGNPDAHVVFTGSSNWAANGSVNDDIVVGLPDERIARQYMRNFDLMWKPGNSRNAYTTTYLNFRGETRKQVVVDPELVYRPAGPFWEDD